MNTNSSHPFWGVVLGLAGTLLITGAAVMADDGKVPMPKPRPLDASPQKDQARVAREQRRAAYVWDGLEQSQLDRLTAALKGKTLDVVIFCADDARCGDLALDFDNAFESAKLKSGIQKPFMDDTKGLATDSADLRDAIVKATGLSVELRDRSPARTTGCTPAMRPNAAGMLEPQPAPSCEALRGPQPFFLAIGSKR